ncbi:GFA family protein [Anaeromyxobacter paludicola]|uniref:Aldehyde-activating protein n=1 Tax=Anaeromyxobacter paludicola TaxID=2918171 RepID=A0ABM7X9N5_9BACT|nr:GFA family protein [Anaeromyxobacter paludicola]BDG08554.1 aldehyde-activating protein [Anaeromyxobacter paludicola]
MAEKTYEGGCHCGAVRYRVTAEVERAVSCNCSICSKTGALLAFAPAERFELLRGADALTDYQWGKKRIHHTFCRHCGVRSFARGEKPGGGEMVAFNLRCVDGVDLGAIPVVSHDGRSTPID